MRWTKTKSTDKTMRAIYEIANDINAAWKNPKYGAVPYLRAMAELKDKNSMYGQDSAKNIVVSFLSNAHGFRGPKAKALKSELREHFLPVKSVKEIVNETVKYYRTHPMGIIGDKCKYFIEETGAMCAVGRCLEQPELFKNQNGCVLFLVQFDCLDSKLKPEYRGHNINFWKHLQCLHDTSNYWTGRTPNSLTLDGLNYKNWIISEFSAD